MSKNLHLVKVCGVSPKNFDIFSLFSFEEIKAEKSVLVCSI